MSLQYRSADVLGRVDIIIDKSKKYVCRGVEQTSDPIFLAMNTYYTKAEPTNNIIMMKLEALSA